MAMMMAGRVLLVCALCVLRCVAGGVYARDVDTNALGGCMASGVLGENGSHMPDGCNKTAITVPLRSVLPITAVEAAAEEDNAGGTRNNSNSSENLESGASTASSAVPGAPAGGGSSGTSAGGQGTGGVSSGSSEGPSTPAALPASSSGGTAGSSGNNSSNTTGDSPTGNQSSTAEAHNSSLPEIPAGTTSGTGHTRQEEEEEEENERQQQSDETQVQQQEHEHPAESGEESAKDKNALRTNATANTGDSDGSTAVSHTTSPLLPLLVVVCAAAAAVVAA
ncbi:Mucin-associated surface protein (MASP) [Trypanosoma cruzi]|uniref:Mucin-associated surface protein (MASP), putative n=2 Tax=Trypanosoma cruzi TaxID=5693 RepID=Q4DYS6_TRYCC|nr:mucin-associated surface protein (MASP), putative [Trypanosoma cruzi]EAN97687.1 mucin-associated surface protein (MASP), putative [Trypanosoma cruzi]PWV14398.1 Mucin-associated surface protein (MASP) [Trypanosoma cruzi]RNC46980.1 mucin-associated surface protein (MASP) [Trypanosoma cruzi]|eukprot:XP_819538.1 mucin-associated surface protein (MASP) [Trypanosoma cruzi strain CL Brener]